MSSVCPFCGIVTDNPHSSQQDCLEALAVEIARLRSVLDHVQSTHVPGPVSFDEPEDPSVDE